MRNRVASSCNLVTMATKSGIIQVDDRNTTFIIKATDIVDQDSSLCLIVCGVV